MKKIKLLSFLMVLLFSVPASAEFYRYVDKNGKVRYTDDYSKVPKNQRSSAGEYRGYENDSTDEATESEADTEIDTQNPSEPAQEIEMGQESETGNAEELDVEKSRLDKKQEEINKELDDLNKEKSELDALKEKVKTKPQTVEYNSNTRAFNEKVKIFTEKQKAFQAEVEVYNDAVANSMKNSLKQYNKEKQKTE